jgi:exodeoxyribonuclease-3
MRIITWNVNGLRAVLKKSWQDFIKAYQPDIICLQEIKISDSEMRQLDKDLTDYKITWNSAEKAGYSGTAILYKNNLKIKVVSIEDNEFKKEGRITQIKVGKLNILSVYIPNGKRDLSRVDYKLDFSDRLVAYIQPCLKNKERIILAGDFNTAHKEIDLARPKDNVKHTGFLPIERHWLDRFLAKDFIDVFRYLHLNEVKYSWWAYRTAARERNIGWRLDYFFVNKGWVKNIEDCQILNDIKGSDHCPVLMDIKD